ncbi:hypothetical protein SO694_00011161 [Aureococcus anophagefferens]
MKGGEVAEGVEAAWISNLTELCPPASRVDARGDDPRDPRPRLTCDFRERMPGCREAQGWRANLSAAELRDPAIPLVAAENAHLAPMSMAREGLLSHVVVNGTLLSYLMIRKSGSRLLGDLMSALAARQKELGRDTHDVVRGIRRVVVFTFVEEPFSRLVSGYHEIDERKNAHCGHERERDSGPGWHCRQPYKLEKEGSQARFEAFVRDVLPLAFDPARLTDAVSYHVHSQSRAVSVRPHVAFVGRLETLRASFLALLAVALDDPEAYVRDAPALGSLLVQKRARSAKVAKKAGLVQGGRADAGCLSNETRRLVLARLGQDYRCFGYPSAYVEAPAPPDPGHCASLRW